MILENKPPEQGHRGFTVLTPEKVCSGEKIMTETQIVIDPQTKRIAKVGDPRDVREWLDAQRKKTGRLTSEEFIGGNVIAGLTDAHQHPAAAAFLNLIGTQDISGKDKRGVLKKVQEMSLEIADPSKLLILHGLDTINIKDLTLNDLQSAAPDRNVLIFDPSFHGGVVSEKMAKKMQTRAAHSQSQFAGYLKANGHFSEEYGLNALEIAEASYSLEDLAQAIDTQVSKYLTQGITSIHDMLLLTPNQFIASLMCRRTWEEKSIEFPVTRFHLRRPQIDEIGKILPELEKSSLLKKDEFPSLVGLKLFADGSFGSYTARVGEEYLGHQQADKAGHGIFLDSLKSMNQGVKVAQQYGLADVAIHAIGDQGIQRALKVARQWLKLGEKAEIHPTFRIEHFELPLPLDQTLREVKSLGIWVVPQPNFLLDNVYKDRLGDRTRWICPHREIVKAGIPMMFGTDGMPDSMLYAIYLATHAGEEHQRLSFPQALLASTVTAADSEGDPRGKIEAGHKADLIIADPALLRELSSDEPNAFHQDKIAHLESLIQRVYKSGVKIFSKTDTSQ